MAGMAPKVTVPGMAFDALVLAGGAARRLSGADKPGLDVGGRPLLAWVLAACAAASRVVVVGPHRDLGVDVGVDVVWARESPAGAGPVAAIAAGLPATSASAVTLLAADLPWIGPAVPVLLEALGDADVAVLVDASGRRNLLAAAWRRASLADRLAALGPPDGAAVRLLYDGVRCVEVADAAGWGRDCDTWDDLAEARHSLAGEDDRMSNPLEAWIAEVAAELGVDPSAVDRDVVLDVARDVAHHVARPAAPLSTFLVGLAAGRAGASVEAVRDAAATVTRLALARPQPD
jgi:molybdopterin-guanine dinucleotide biosynthesis protein A